MTVHRAASELVEALDALDAPPKVSRLQASLLLAQVGIRPLMLDLAEALRLRTLRAEATGIGGDPA